MYLVGAEDFSTKTNYVYHHLPIFERGSNCSIEVLHRLLTHIYIERFKRGKRGLPKTLWIHLDNCWRENKNQFLLAFLAELVKREVFDEVQVFFLSVGELFNF